MYILRPIKAAVKQLMQRNGLSLNRADDLTRLADEFGSDKGNNLSSHGYTRIYSRLFERMRQREIILLEMGLLRADMDGRRLTNAAEGRTGASGTLAPSLEMWRAFFPKARLYGFDIDDFSDVFIERCTIVRGDMSSAVDLGQLVQIIGKPIDIVIDDASHVSHHQQIALGHLFPYVRPGGMYIMEDLHWQDSTLEVSGAPKTRDILRRLQAIGIFESPFLTMQQCKYVAANLEALRLYDSSTREVDDGTDALAILTKTQVTVEIN